jgi:hypothetical protein
LESNAGQVHRTVAEKRRIVALTLAPAMSVARVAQAEGVNSHQVFQWRRAFRAGGLLDRSKKTAELLPVMVTAEGVGQSLASQSRAGINAPGQPGQAGPGGTIHIRPQARPAPYSHSSVSPCCRPVGQLLLDCAIDQSPQTMIACPTLSQETVSALANKPYAAGITQSALIAGPTASQ